MYSRRLRACRNINANRTSGTVVVYTGEEVGDIMVMIMEGLSTFSSDLLIIFPIETLLIQTFFVSNGTLVILASSDLHSNNHLDA